MPKIYWYKFTYINLFKLHHTFSSNGKTNWFTDSTYIHKREDFTWTSKEIRSISPIYDGNNFYIYYAGHTNTSLGIGFSICK